MYGRKTEGRSREWEGHHAKEAGRLCTPIPMVTNPGPMRPNLLLQKGPGVYSSCPHFSKVPHWRPSLQVGADCIQAIGPKKKQCSTNPEEHVYKGLPLPTNLRNSLFKCRSSSYPCVYFPGLEASGITFLFFSLQSYTINICH